MLGCTKNLNSFQQNNDELPKTNETGVDKMENIHWLGHSSFKITGEKTVYIDPFKIKDAKHDADVVLITHGHYDHCNKEDIIKVVNKNTVVAMTADCQSTIGRVEVKQVVLVEPNKQYNVSGLNIETIPAYNLDKPYHPKENEWVGYILTINGKRIYHAGDTDNIPEMVSLKNIDVALVPVSGIYVMTPEEAAAAVNIFKPKVAVPIHWGTIVGNIKDAEKFKQLSQVPVEILQKE